VRVLWVATKAPWPPRDGGRLLQWLTLQALAELRGEVEVDLVAPLLGAAPEPIREALSTVCRPHLVAARLRPLPLAAVAARTAGLPVTAARHRLPAIGKRVQELAARGGYRVVHAEQAQAMPQALLAGLPVVLRAQNVESDLWGGGVTAGGAPAPGWARTLRGEARRLASWEGEMVRRAARAVAVTPRDAARLDALAALAAAPGGLVPRRGSRDGHAGGAGAASQGHDPDEPSSPLPVVALPVPFPAELPPGPPLPGSPAIVLLAGAGWRPNREGAERFLATTWPAVRAALPAAHLHVFGEVPGAGGPGVTVHAAPRDGAAAFPAGALLVVPLATASGIRMKILEAWARGVAVVASPAAAAGLEATNGEELLVAELGAPMAAALSAAGADAALAERLRAGGRRLLLERHSPRVAAAGLLAVWRAAAATAPPRP
jgi:hypothetical protein